MTGGTIEGVGQLSDAPPDLATTLMGFISEELLEPDTPIEPGTDLLLSGMVDSLGVIQIVDFLEEATGCRIDPIDVVLDHFATVNAMVGFMATLSR